MQNNILDILKKHPVIPVVSIYKEEEIDDIYNALKKKGISCIEITLRTEYAWNAVQEFKQRYGEHMDIGVGTIISVEQINRCADLKVDFMVSPGLTSTMVQNLEHSGIPFIPGVATPSEIIRGMEIGWRYFKFFPANLYGGIEALKSYGSVFNEVKFCPTGGINESNYQEYLSLDNVISVGGSWVIK
jgi:2-dehydro-3-deoxyphosphogluconate aldolase/(4S)-4-hydroxy-2-oxoglutarate aldolase